MSTSEAGPEPEPETTAAAAAVALPTIGTDTSMDTGVVVVVASAAVAAEEEKVAAAPITHVLLLHHSPCVDGDCALGIVQCAAEVGGFTVTPWGVDHRKNADETDATVLAWVVAQRGNPGALVLYLDVSPSTKVTACMATEWSAGSSVRMHIGDHHISVKAAVGAFQAQVRDMGTATSSRLTVEWGEEGTQVSGCTLAQRWAEAAGCHVPDLNPEVLTEVAFTDTTGDATPLTRALKSPEITKPAWRDVVRLPAAEVAKYRSAGRGLLANLCFSMAPLLEKVLVAAELFSPTGVTLYIVRHDNPLDATDLADALWASTGANDDDTCPAPNRNSVLLMRTGDKTTSLRNSRLSRVNALKAAQMLAEQFPGGKPPGEPAAGGHDRAAGLWLPVAILDSMFQTATPPKFPKCV